MVTFPPPLHIFAFVIVLISHIWRYRLLLVMQHTESVLTI